MPKGVRGSGPYSKVNADGTPKASTEAGTTRTRARKTTTRRTRKTATRARAATNGHKTVTALGSFRSVSVSSDGKIVLETKTGRKLEASLDRPSALLDLAEDANAAVDEFIANR